MSRYYEEFMIYFLECNKEASVTFALGKLENGEIGIVELYEEILKPALNNQVCHYQEKQLCIWKEHIRSAIVRTIIECAYPYVIKERDAHNTTVKGQVAVLCPDGEYHEIGARMVSDYFTLEGYDAIFIGSSTPKEEFLDVLNTIKPDIIALSVTNYYNLVSAKRTIQAIREKSQQKIMIVAGGYAFENNPDAVNDIGADRLIANKDDIKKLKKEGAV